MEKSCNHPLCFGHTSEPISNRNYVTITPTKFANSAPTKPPKSNIRFKFGGITVNVTNADQVKVADNLDTDGTVTLTLQN